MEPKRAGPDYYQWRVFMDESPTVLSQVESVLYRLHPTFPNPIHLVDDPRSNFALTSQGWGEFLMRITVFLKDGLEYHTSYYLDLEKPWPEDTTVRN